ncbi:hypothetical protein DL89DRAFT_256311 [Linderina pennispora]|uniref:Pentacotripeptide-repeat region of PRORP domain-containing protein n=1 Tax=Linderina pennispora TaxID=61395 RepID=A0A1Y1WCK2_9FUNG|nr:uncharacterized protein DL89DRAFT_256311 [Linderina pennispora]ORX71277.1 hypothetical protein DL89DRAFT_256311 [Linderina pennispora]
MRGYGIQRLKSPSNDAYMLELVLNGIAMARIPSDTLLGAETGRQSERSWAGRIDVRSIAAVHRLVNSGMVEPPICCIVLVADMVEQQARSLHMHLAQQTVDSLLGQCIAYVSRRSAFVRSLEATDDDRQSFELSLRVIRTLVVHTGINVMEGWSRLSRSAMAVRVFQRLSDFDAQLGNTHTQNALTLGIITRLLDGLLSTPIHKDILAQCAIGMLEKHSRFIGAISEDALAALLQVLCKAADYEHVATWARHIPAPTINADIARTVLIALRKQQIALVRGNRRFLARHIVGALGRYRRDSLTAAHLTKLLEIEIGAAPVSASIPRALDIWLSSFRKFGIVPTIETFTVIIDATVSFTLPDRTPVVLSAPAPNAVTWASVARVWCQTGDWDRVHMTMAMIKQSGNKISPRLVTRVVSEAVDRGDVAKAHQFWTEYGCTAGKAANGEALAKLIFGYARIGDAVAATELFECACACQTRQTGRQSNLAAHLTGLLNTVLRCSLDAITVEPMAAGDDMPVDLSFDSQAIRIAHRFGVRFDVVTYNVLLAQLSRRVCQIIAGLESGRVDLFATAMHRLYLRMHDEGIMLDEMTLAHLVPVWLRAGHLELIRMHWHMCVQGRTTSKTAQAKRHVLHQIRRWNMNDSAIETLLDIPLPPKE